MPSSKPSAERPGRSGIQDRSADRSAATRGPRAGSKAAFDPKVVDHQKGETELPSFMRRYLLRLAKRGAFGKTPGRLNIDLDYGPQGTMTVTSVTYDRREAQKIAERGSTAGNGPADALTAARHRGKSLVAKVLAGEEMLSVDEFAERYGSTKTTVNTKRQKGDLLALRGAVRGYRYPAWQIGEDGREYPEIKEISERLESPWAAYRFLTQRHCALDGLTGLEVLRQGRGRAAIDAADGIAQGDFT